MGKKAKRNRRSLHKTDHLKNEKVTANEHVLTKLNQVMEQYNDVILKLQVFNSKNYASRKKLIQVNLRAYVWSDTILPYVATGENASERIQKKADREQRDAKAFTFIYNHLDITRQMTVNSAETVIDLFKILDATYERMGPIDVVTVQTKIGAMRYDINNP